MEVLPRNPKRQKTDSQLQLPVLSTAGDEVENLGSGARWNDLHIELVKDILGHIPTLRRVKYRRVSRGWKRILENQGVRATSVLILQFADLKFWKAFCGIAPDVRWNCQFCLGVDYLHGEDCSSRLIFFHGFITSHTKIIFIDCERQENIPAVLDHYYVNTPLQYPKELLPTFVEYLPQIQKFVLHHLSCDYTRALNLEADFFLGLGPELGAERSVMLSKLFIRSHCWKGTPSVTCLIDGAVEVPRWSELATGAYIPNATLKCKDTFEEIYASKDYAVLFDLWKSVVWPYPPEQLKWLDETLGQLVNSPKWKDETNLTMACRDLSEDLDDQTRRTVKDGHLCVHWGEVHCRLQNRIVNIEGLLGISSYAEQCAKVEHLPLPPFPFASALDLN